MVKYWIEKYLKNGVEMGKRQDKKLN